MSTVGMLFMVLICSVVWGGFLLLLGLMMRSERRRVRYAETQRD